MALTDLPQELLFTVLSGLRNRDDRASWYMMCKDFDSIYLEARRSRTKVYGGNHNAWVTGADEEDTTRLIQEQIIPHASQGDRESGATFEADKTSMTHFRRRMQQDDSRPVWFEGNAIYPQQSVKVLGLTLDKKLGMDEHIARVVQEGT